MAQRLCCFLVVFLLMFVGKSYGQVRPELLPVAADHKKLNEFEFGTQLPAGYIAKGPVIFRPGYFSRPVISSNRSGTVNFPVTPGFSKQFHSVISPTHYVNTMGFVCRKEFQLEKLTTLPFRFRLGSLEYVNYMEQKPNALMPRH
jgi:hypothetical protein